MTLLSEPDRQAVRARLAGLANDVTLLLFSQTIGGPETGPIARGILDEVAGLHDRIAVEEANFVLDKDRAGAFGVDKIPAIVLLRNGVDTRMRFFGAPSGYEFMSLLDAILLAGGEESGLTPESKALVAAVDEPMSIEVFVTPT